MATKDFSSKQIRVSQLLASGGIAGTTAGMAIYSASNASNLEGGISDGAIFNNVGSDVFLFVSGTSNVTTSDRANVTLFGGDVVVSGTIYAERQVIEVDETTSGSLSVSGSLYVKQGAQINLEQGVSFPANTFQVSSNQGSAFAVYGSPSDVDVSQPAVYVNPANAQIDFFVKTDNAKSAIVVDAQREYIAFMSGGIGDSPSASNPRTMSDVNFSVSGSIGGKNSTSRGIAVFGGDVFVSGSLYSDQEIQAYSNIRLSDEEGSAAPTIYMNTAGSVYLQENNNNLFIEANNTMDISIDNTLRVNGASETNPIFVISNDIAYADIKGTLVNFSQDDDQDFSVSTANQKRAIFVSASDDSVMIHAEGLPPVGGDTAFFVSGSAYDASAGSFDPNNFGEASGKISQFGGDVIVSGAIVGKNDSLSGISGETNNLFLAAENSIYGTATSFGFYGDVANLQDVGSDMFYFVSGTIGGKGTEGVAVFGGDVVASGSLIVEEQVRGKETYTLGPFYRHLSNTTEGIVNYSSNTLDTASPNGDSWQYQHQWVAPCSGTLRAVSCMTYGTPGSAGNPTPSKVIFAMRKNIFFGGAYPDPTTHFSASMRDNSGIRLGAISNGISAVFNAVDGGSTPATDPDYEAIGQAISGSAPFSFAPGDVIFLSVKPETAQVGWYITCNFILELETQKIK